MLAKTLATIVSFSVATVLVSGCAAADLEEPTSELESDLAAGCTSTAAEIQLRSFIPQTLCGKSDTKDDSEESCSEEGGFPEPPLFANKFHGDHRSFSTKWNASSRVAALVKVDELAPSKCKVADGALSGDVGESHRCVRPFGGGEYQLESKTAAVGLSKNERRCEGSTWRGTVQAHAGYPFMPSPHVFDELDVSAQAAASKGGRIQRYTVSYAHTPFPNAELLVRYACGKKVAVLHKREASGCTPSPLVLGEHNARNVSGTLSFAIRAENGKITLEQ